MIISKCMPLNAHTPCYRWFQIGEKYPIDEARLFGIRVVSQCSVELDELVHHLVAHQSLPDKQDQVWGIDPDKLKRGGRGEGRKD